MNINIEAWLPEIILTALGGLMAIVRTGDVARFNKMEERLDKLETNIVKDNVELRDRLDEFATENREQLSDLRKELNDKHNIVLAAVVSSNGKKI
jgi:dihydroxyacid dehydratase/phosphogluconate dehydratase